MSDELKVADHEDLNDFLKTLANEVYKKGEVNDGYKYIDDNDEWDGGEDRTKSMIFKELATGQLYEVYGYYDSWNGTEWEGVYKVEAVEKTITVYSVQS